MIIPDEDIGKIDVYSKRVLHLSIERTANIITHTVWSCMGRYQKQHGWQMFPCLNSLTINFSDISPNALQWLDFIVTPTLSEVRVTGIDISNEASLGIYLDRLWEIKKEQNIEHLSLSGDLSEDFVTKIQSLSVKQLKSVDITIRPRRMSAGYAMNLVSKVTNLRKIGIILQAKEGFSDPPSMQHIGTSIGGDQPIDITFNKTLDKVYISGYPWQIYVSFFQHTRFTQLRKLTIDFNYDIVGDESTIALTNDECQEECFKLASSHISGLEALTIITDPGHRRLPWDLLDYISNWTELKHLKLCVPRFSISSALSHTPEHESETSWQDPPLPVLWTFRGWSALEVLQFMSPMDFECAGNFTQFSLSVLELLSIAECCPNLKALEVKGYVFVLDEETVIGIQKAIDDFRELRRGSKAPHGLKRLEYTESEYRGSYSTPLDTRDSLFTNLLPEYLASVFPRMETVSFTAAEHEGSQIDLWQLLNTKMNSFLDKNMTK